MKRRYMAFFLVALLLPCCIAVPARAADTSNANWINVFDYAMPNGSDSLMHLPGTFTFELPFDTTFYSVDLIIRSEYEDLDISFEHPSGRGWDLTRELISKDSGFLYRFYGDFNGWNFKTFLLHAYMEIPGLIVFESFRVSTLKYTRSDVECQALFSTDDSSIEDGVINYPSSDSFTVNVGVNSSVNMLYHVFISSVNWRKVDYWDLSLFVHCDDILSISAQLDDLILPCEVGYIGESTLGDNFYTVNIRVDLTDLDRSKDTAPLISLFGTLTAPISQVMIVSSVGYVRDNGLNPVTTWLRNIFDSIKAGFASVVDTIASWGQKIVDAFSPDSSAVDQVVDDAASKGDQLGGLNQQIGSMEKPDISGSGDISGIISPGDLSTSATFLTTVVNAPYISQVVMLCLILSLAAYVLFGKRG